MSTFETDFNKWFKQIKADIFDIAFEPTLCGLANINQLAERSDLSWMTVQNLYDGTTKRPHLYSVYKLARAVGIDLRYARPPMPKRQKRVA